jgi:hypothetical protein
MKCLVLIFYVRKFVIERKTVVHMHPDWCHATTEFYLEVVFVEVRWMFVLREHGNRCDHDRSTQTAERVVC